MAAGRQIPTREKVESSLGRRHRRERLFQFFGVAATLVGVFFLAIFFWTLIAQGSSAFVQSFLTLDVEFSEEILAPTENSISNMRISTQWPAMRCARNFRT